MYEQITDDYFGYDLYITFKLQVKEESREEWQDAADYFRRELGDKFETVFLIRKPRSRRKSTAQSTKPPAAPLTVCRA